MSKTRPGSPRGCGAVARAHLPSANATGYANQPVSADERSSAEQAALSAVGSGTVTELDRSDDADHAWEVEVTGADGRDTDVEFDASFTIVKVD